MINQHAQEPQHGWPIKNGKVDAVQATVSIRVCVQRTVQEAGHRENRQGGKNTSTATGLANRKYLKRQVREAEESHIPKHSRRHRQLSNSRARALLVE
jgi:hypothetical protein